MKQFIVETSARHVHVTQQDLETLFGKGYELTVKKMLSQPGQYASAERVDVVGPKKTLTGVSILGPVRSATQVELSLTALDRCPAAATEASPAHRRHCGCTSPGRLNSRAQSPAAPSSPSWWMPSAGAFPRCA